MAFNRRDGSIYVCDIRFRGDSTGGDPIRIEIRQREGMQLDFALAWWKGKQAFMDENGKKVLRNTFIRVEEIAMITVMEYYPLYQTWDREDSDGEYMEENEEKGKN